MRAQRATKAPLTSAADRLASNLRDLADGHGGDHLGGARHQRKQILQPIRACAEDDDRNTRRGDIVLITQIAIHRDENLEACVSHQAEEFTVSLTRPTFPRHGRNGKPGELTTEPVGHALVEQDASP